MYRTFVHNSGSMDFADVNAKWVVWKRTATDEEKAGLQAEGVVATEVEHTVTRRRRLHIEAKHGCERRG